MANQSGCLVVSSVAILCDWQNVRGTGDQLRCLINFARKFGTIVCKQAYAHWKHENSQHEELLDEWDFECFNVPSSKHKRNNVDKQLIAHCRAQILSNPDVTTVILLSGDGDFKGLVRDLKAAGKKAIVIAECWKRTSKKLVNLADESYLLKQLC